MLEGRSGRVPGLRRLSLRSPEKAAVRPRRTGRQVLDSSGRARQQQRVASKPQAGLHVLNRRKAAMMMEWEEYRKQLIATIQQIGQASPDIVRGYRTIADGAAKIGKLDPKVRELISLAVAVTARCDGCIVTHVDAAVRHGATKEELIEALGVAISVNAGAALVYSARTLDAFAARTGPTSGT